MEGFAHLLSVVEEVVSQVVAYVSKDAATIDSGSSIPTVGKYCVCKLPEWSCEDNE